MPEIDAMLAGLDFDYGWVSLALIVVAVLLFKKLLRFALFLALLGVVFLVVEAQGFDLTGYIVSALNDLRLDELFQFLKGD